MTLACECSVGCNKVWHVILLQVGVMRFGNVKQRFLNVMLIGPIGQKWLSIGILWSVQLIVGQHTVYVDAPQKDGMIGDEPAILSSHTP